MVNYQAFMISFAESFDCLVIQNKKSHNVFIDIRMPFAIPIKHYGSIN